MEKLLYVYWRNEESAEALRRRFIAQVKGQLLAAGAERLQININDFTDASGAIENFKLQSLRPKPDGIVSFWLSSAYRRAPLERLLAPHFARLAGYVVAESTILPNLEHPGREDERTSGFSQVTLLQVPPRLGFDEWRRIWFTQHTPVGIETQANFRYVQNVVVMPLETGLPPLRGIVEECFPLAAMRDLRAFYDAVDDEAKFHRHVTSMMESCTRFIDFDRIDVLPTSEYMLHSQSELRV
ncbi:MAG TPA: EthD domain-containing protein [Steroidobacteraceae bacterium]|nr:EthD domain-containing protein [Steroidobacteraceae bacterium]